MIVFCRLADGNAILGDMIEEQNDYFVFENSLLVDSAPQHHVEQQYYFKGMYQPFNTSNSIISTFQKHHIISMDKDIDYDLIRHYNKYVAKWFEARNNHTIDQNKQKKTDKTLEMLLEYLSEDKIIH